MFISSEQTENNSVDNQSNKLMIAMFMVTLCLTIYYVQFFVRFSSLNYLLL